MRLALLLVLSTLTATSSIAQIQQGNCTATGSAVADLAANNVRARLYNNGGLFWKGAGNVYNVPAAAEGQPITPNAMFAAGIWVGGLVDGQPRTAASAYGPWEFYPGPLDASGGLVDPTCSRYDRIWTVSKQQVRDFLSAPTSAVAPDLRDWPVGLGAPAYVDANRNGAFDEGESEVTVTSVDQTIDLGPELPLFPGNNSADEMAWWVMNDVGGSPGSTGSAPIGLEVQVTAYAFRAPGALNNTTFYRYRMFYRGTTPLTDAYLGFWNDPDVGNASDDYVGSDATLGYGFAYNADNEDEGADGYGFAPPAIGINFFQGPLVPAPGQTHTDPDGTVYQDQTRLGTTVFLYYDNANGPNGNPRNNSTDWYNYLQGIWQDDKPMVNCGDGYGPTNAGLACFANQAPTSFMWPGNPSAGEFWSETNFDNAGSASAPGDRRFIQSTGPFEFAPGTEQTIQFGIVWSRGSSNLNSVDVLRTDMAEVAGFFDSGFASRPRLSLPAGVPTLVTPVAEAVVASGNVTFTASMPTTDDRVEIQISRSETFSASDTSTTTVFNDARVSLTPGSYFVRARYTIGTEVGPWSDPIAFSVSDVTLAPYDRGSIVSFEVSANANGPVVPAHPAAAAYAGFPTPDITADGVGDDPSDAQQVGPARWLVYAGGAFGGYDSFLDRAIISRGRTEADLAGRTFEIRFTADGSTAYRRFQDNAAVQVPFEIWSTPTETPDDPSDDVKLIPVLNDVDNNGTFNLSTRDSPVSSAENDPFTDWIYFFDPVDTTSGTAGYDAYANGGTLDLTKVGEETLARIVLVSWNAGNQPPYAQELPEEGTVFRIVVSGESAIDAPVPLSPADATSFDTAPRLYWAQPEGITATVEVATDIDFRSPVPFTAVYGGGGAESSATIDAIDAGSYFWRVVLVSQQGDSVRSAARSFTVSQTITSNEAAETPQSLTLLSPAPHPINGPSRLRFFLPTSGEVRMEAYDLMGRRIAVLAEGAQAQGWSEAAWPDGLSAGVYLVRLRAGSETQTRQVVVVR